MKKQGGKNDAEQKKSEWSVFPVCLIDLMR